MKKTLLICGALLAFAAPAFAQLPPGIDLHWNDCFQGVTPPLPALDMSNTCNSNSGVVTMVASFVPHTPLPQYEANLCVIDLQTSNGGAVLNPWWHLENPGPCANRQGKVNCDANFTLVSGCNDFWVGAATPALLYTTPSPAPSLAGLPSARIKAVAGVAQTAAGLVDPSAVWYALKVNILKSGTVGACNLGCQDRACIVLNQMNLSQPAPVPDDVLTSALPLPGASQYITYLGAAGTNCPGATPANNKTWGQLKSLYR